MTDETTTPGTDLVFAQAPLQQRMNWAKAVASAGDLVPKGYRNADGSPNPAKVLIAAEYASTLGLAPIVGLTGINVVEGKPSLSAGLISALIRRAGHTLRITTRGIVEGGDFAAIATLIRRDDPDHPFVATWTPQRAQRAALCKYAIDPATKQWKVTARSQKGNPLPWETYTEGLCKARAVTEVGRDGAEDVLFGISYTAEELGVTPGDDGGLFDATPGSRDVTRPPAPSEEPVDAEIVDETTGEVRDPAAHGDPAPWEDAIADALATGGVERLRRVWRDANDRGVLNQPMANGHTLDATIVALAARLDQDRTAEETSG